MGISKAKAVAGGGYHSLALMADGTVKAWGRNGEGQLGDRSNTTRNRPVSVYGLSGIAAIAGGGYHSLAIPEHAWYLAEGSTYGGMETWVCVQNPNPGQVTVDLTFMTETGPVTGPQDFSIPGNSRYSFLLNSLVPGKKDVSTKVISTGGEVVCERSVYGPGKAWAHESVGAIFPSDNWYLAEGSTYGGMESWVCVQNPNGVEVRVNLFFTTETDAVTGPQNFPIPRQSRYSFLLNSLVPGKKDVSTKVISTGGEVVCERSVYGPGKAWAHESVGAIFPSDNWYLAEGSTYGGMESWVCVQNPTPFPVTVDLTFMTETGPVTGTYNGTSEP